MTTTEPKPVAPVEFHGIQDGCGVMESFDLWNATEDFAGVAKHSTISEQTIHALGFVTPREAR